MHLCPQAGSIQNSGRNTKHAKNRRSPNTKYRLKRPTYTGIIGENAQGLDEYAPNEPVQKLEGSFNAGARQQQTSLLTRRENNLSITFRPTLAKAIRSNTSCAGTATNLMTIPSSRPSKSQITLLLVIGSMCRRMKQCHEDVDKHTSTGRYQCG